MYKINLKTKIKYIFIANLTVAALAQAAGNDPLVYNGTVKKTGPTQVTLTYDLPKLLPTLVGDLDQSEPSKKKKDKEEYLKIGSCKKALKFEGAIPGSADLLKPKQDWDVTEKLSLTLPPTSISRNYSTEGKPKYFWILKVEGLRLLDDKVILSCSPVGKTMCFKNKLPNGHTAGPCPGFPYPILPFAAPSEASSDSAPDHS